MVRKITVIFLTLGMISGSFACRPKSSSMDGKAVENKEVQIPVFNADSAYQFTANQLFFGPRVPNTEAHRNCGAYIAEELRRFGAKVIEQGAILYTYNNVALPAKNIIGSFQPENKNRVLLCAHWDSRPFADHDPNEAYHHTPIDGANDSAGACGILLEIARQIQQQQPLIGIDLIFFDAEDWGAPTFDHHASDGWCLGSEYWAKNPHVANYQARYGILMDMASATNAQFYKEKTSMYYAKNVVDKVWEAAQAAGYGSYFINKEGGYVQDDHIPVNEIRRIPCIDIIQYDPTTETGFGAYWHTMSDNLDAVGAETLKAVGQTLLQVIYREK
ncbi:MAG: M28 family peptidase [Dysgonamonadaceae bacterium]|nr:M28 family peptidase [Dysgonamonadaceae bacterium]